MYIENACIYVYLETDLRGPVFSGMGGGVLAGVGLKLAEVGFRGMPHGAFALSRYCVFITKKTCTEAFEP